DWLRANRTLPTPEIMKTTAAKLRGHYAYYGVTDNSKRIRNFAHEVRTLLFKWLNRRGTRTCMSWGKFELLLQRYPLPQPRIMVTLW
ncbi:MAG: group II intron maturase-specific domain-containing protein, partial [Pseudomonadota bacterium]